MYAIIRLGGKQYRVEETDFIRFEMLDAEINDIVQIDDVLMVGGETNILGAPTVDGAYVEIRISEHMQAKKVINFVRRRRKNSSKRTKGHRQWHTYGTVEKIHLPGAES